MGLCQVMTSPPNAAADWQAAASPPNTVADCSITPKRHGRPWQFAASLSNAVAGRGKSRHHSQTPRQTLAICGITVKHCGRLQHPSQMQWRVPVSPLNATSLPNAAAGCSQSHHCTQTFWQTVASRGIVPKRHGWPWAHLLHSLLCHPGMQLSLGATNTYWGGKRQWKMGDKLASVRTV